MKVKEDTFDVGVIVGRFQVPSLHEAHTQLIQHVCNQHDKVLVVLGVSPLRATTENPLDWQARRQMLLQVFPNIDVLYIKDKYHDEAWSKSLDEIVEDYLTTSQNAVLYGGRDSFIAHYSGKLPTRELEADRYTSGSEIRKEVSRRSTRETADFRAGVVWAAFNRFPTAYPTVDVAVFNEDETKILLARKSFEKQWRLIGGFADPTSASYEADARREVQEEAGIAITDPKYVGSFLVDDWRYRREVDKIKTLLFKAKLQSGAPKPDDDVAEVGWFECSELAVSDIVDNHQEMVFSVIPAKSQR